MERLVEEERTKKESDKRRRETTSTGLAPACLHKEEMTSTLALARDKNPARPYYRGMCCRDGISPRGTMTGNTGPVQ